MLSEKTKHYFIAKTQSELLERFNNRDQILEKFPFGEVLLLRNNDTVYAIKNKCPHQGASMEGCAIKGQKVICPVHQYAFDLQHGRGHGLYLKTFPIVTLEDGVYLARTYFSWFGE